MSKNNPVVKLEVDKASAEAAYNELLKAIKDGDGPIIPVVKFAHALKAALATPPQKPN